ncbi:hypothetical protein Bca52824_032730 [Brassica carinata]|uniref:Uncharacterized protein n=1 Tax=Brassica carinata TaxID=52824 RepID=A0A8X7V6G7_BRACI|nr:hypothetical protein Bca52824_032730 [Brassica carinata]
MQNQANRRGRIHFAELETGGLRAACPQCHVLFTPHLGHLLKARSWGPMPSLKTLVCGGCSATIIYQKDDRSVKCFPCKHITHPQETNEGVSTFYQFVPLQVNRVGPSQGTWVTSQEVNRVVPPQTNRVIPLQVDLVSPSIVNLVIPHQINRFVHPQINRAVPSQANRVIPPQVDLVNPSIVNLVIPHQINRAVHPQINRAVPPLTNRVIPPQIGLVDRSIVNLVIPHQINRIVHPQINRAIPPQINRRKRKANAETESTATSPFTAKLESESTSAFVADYVARLVRDCAPGMRANKRKVEEEDKTETKNKKTVYSFLVKPHRRPRHQFSKAENDIDLYSLPCHPTTSPVISIADQIDLRWSNRDCLPPWSCLSFSTV